MIEFKEVPTSRGAGNRQVASLEAVAICILRIIADVDARAETFFGNFPLRGEGVCDATYGFSGAAPLSTARGPCGGHLAARA